MYVALFCKLICIVGLIPVLIFILVLIEPDSTFRELYTLQIRSLVLTTSEDSFCSGHYIWAYQTLPISVQCN